MQEFYKAAQRFTQDPAGEDQAKLKLTLDSAVTVLVKGNFEVEETCRKFLACDGKLAVSILPESMPATAEPKKPLLNPLVGGFSRPRTHFIKKTSPTRGKLETIVPYLAICESSSKRSVK